MGGLAVGGHVVGGVFEGRDVEALVEGLPLERVGMLPSIGQ